jgi:hypothetical protein
MYERMYEMYENVRKNALICTPYVRLTLKASLSYILRSSHLPMANTEAVAKVLDSSLEID